MPSGDASGNSQGGVAKEGGIADRTLTKKKVASAQNPENSGAVNTQTCTRHNRPPMCTPT